MIPPYLTDGDKVAIVSPSGNIDPNYLSGIANVLQSWGLQPLIAPNAGNVQGRFAGTRQERLADLQWALDTREIKAVFCSRGGYGLVQIIDNVDFEHFELYPKWVVGFSDITILHSAITAHDIASLHGAMAKDICENAEIADLERQFLFGQLHQHTIDAHPLNRIGAAKGKITGGNLSVFCGLRGTYLDNDLTGKILFIEDVGEKPYQIDRYLHNLKIGGIFEEIAALIVGQFTEYEEDETMNASLHQIIRDVVEEYDFPVVFNFPAGHVPYNLLLPFGVPATLNVEAEKISLKF